MARPQPLPAAWLGIKTLTGAHIPLHANAPGREIEHLHMNAGLTRLKIGLSREVGHPMLALDRVVGLTAVDPVAIHTDAHAGRTSPDPHSDGCGW